MSQENRYTVDLIFKGLVMAHVGPSGLLLMMPDCRAPTTLFPPNPPEYPEPRPLREHSGALEFYLDDWQNPSDSIPGLLQIKKPGKDAVGLYMLDRQMIRLSAARDRIGLPAALEADDDDYNTGFAEVPGLMKILDKKGHLRSFRRLTPFGDTATGALPLKARAWESCVGFSLLDVGEVLSDRPSRRGNVDLSWEMRPLGAIGQSKATTTINLDLHVRLSLLAADTLVVELWKLHTDHEAREDQPHLPDPRRAPARIDQFLLRPEDAQGELKLWIKNMELDELLVDTDDPEDPFPRDCTHRVGREDRDHLFFAELTDQRDDVVIPVCEDDKFASCGAGCGPCQGGP